jgi:hypothetical protein
MLLIPLYWIGCIAQAPGSIATVKDAESGIGNHREIIRAELPTLCLTTTKIKGLLDMF